MKKRILSLDLLPTPGGEWIKAGTKNVFFSETASAKLSLQGLGLAVIKPNVCDENSARASLFKAFGVGIASEDMARTKILNQYPTQPEVTLLDRGITLEVSMAHLEFLYLSHGFATKNNRDLFRIQVYCQSARNSSRMVRRPFTKTCYFPR